MLLRSPSYSTLANRSLTSAPDSSVLLLRRFSNDGKPRTNASSFTSSLTYSQIIFLFNRNGPSTSVIRWSHVRASSELSVEWRPKRTTSTRRTERKPRSKEDPREAKARDRVWIPVTLPIPFTSPRPGTSARPASLPSPTRPAPQSKSLFRSYGSNLPTFLTYISLSTRGSLPWRPATDMGTNRRDTSTWPSPGFSRSEGKIRKPPTLRCSSRS
ncbi:hypothetical protein M0802_014070 [Mischocyttarus mexicanus]|nr:hypothetical protein M0802_014070 [Mischocyttarus mexicanus]